MYLSINVDLLKIRESKNVENNNYYFFPKSGAIAFKNQQIVHAE